MRGFALLTLTAGLSAVVATPAAAQSGSIQGSWKAADGKSVIRFDPCGAALCGTIAQFLVPEPRGGARDDNNPNKALRSRKLLGLQIFNDLTPAGGRYKGKGYSPEDGRYFNAQVWREGNLLKVKGCVTVICRTVSFSKV